ncbi:uncharacterized protein V6R79_025926 [Siganus canaliculatus]
MQLPADGEDVLEEIFTSEPSAFTYLTCKRLLGASDPLQLAAINQHNRGVFHCWRLNRLETTLRTDAPASINGCRGNHRSPSFQGQTGARVKCAVRV